MERRYTPTDDWQLARLGKLTASEIHKIAGENRNKTETLSEGAKAYILEKVTERVLKSIKVTKETDSMLWGASTEQDAVNACLFDFEYFGAYNNRFFDFNEISGGSPDGVGDDFIVEIKCPYNSENHLANMLIDNVEKFKKLHKEYYWQCVFNKIILKKEKVKFISFDPDFGKNSLFVFDFVPNKEDEQKLLQKLVEAKKFYLEIFFKINI